MSSYAWLGVFGSAFLTTLALASYAVMAVPYFEDGPLLTDLRYKPRIAVKIGLMLFLLFFALYYFGAIYLDETTSGPLLLFGMIIISLPISMLLGTETWDRYDARGMNNVPGAKAVAIATGIGMMELAVTVVTLVLLL